MMKHCFIKETNISLVSQVKNLLFCVTVKKFTMSLNTELLARMVRERRGTKGLREVAHEIGGLSAPTLSRIENGKVPDVETFLMVCRWLNVKPDLFDLENANSVDDRQMQILALLRGDRKLDSDTLKILELMIESAYKKKL